MKGAHAIIKEMVVTEKGTRQTERDNQYQFKVDRRANKLEIKRAVEQLFKVNVTAVNTMNRPGKLKRERTMHYGHTASWKKAVVTLKKGETIELT
jgi:large subunit ribosomal protein L23